MTNVLPGSTAGSTTVKTTQQGRLTVARRNPAFLATPSKPGLTGTAAGNEIWDFQFLRFIFTWLVWHWLDIYSGSLDMQRCNTIFLKG